MKCSSFLQKSSPLSQGKSKVLVEPTEVSAAFGRRRLAFFRSPGGFVFEVMQVLERKI